MSLRTSCRVLGVAGPLLVALVAMGAEPAGDVPSPGASDGGSDWPAFLGPTGDSKSTERGILTDWSDGRLKVLWQRKLYESYGIGAVSRGCYYQFDRVGEKAVLLCWDAATGRQRWQAEYPTFYEDLYGYNGGPRNSPLVDGDRVYLFGVDGWLACVQAGDGRVVWQVDTAGRYGVVQNFFGVGSNPVIDGRLLIVMVGGSPPESREAPPGALERVVGNGSGIVAFDKHTGEEVYRITDELASYASLKLATIQGRRWCLAFARGGLVGFEPTTGKVDFHYPWRARLLESVNAAVPVVVGDEVFISETYGPGSSLLRVRPGGCEVIWRDDPEVRRKAMQTHWNTPIHHEGYLYGSSGRHMYQAKLRCIEWQTGKIQWEVPDLTRTSLLYADGHFISLGEYGDLVLFKANPAKFEQVAEAKLRSAEGQPLLEYPCWAAPILSQGRLYVRGRYSVVCLELIPQP